MRDLLPVAVLGASLACGSPTAPTPHDHPHDHDHSHPGAHAHLPPPAPTGFNLDLERTPDALTPAVAATLTWEGDHRVRCEWSVRGGPALLDAEVTQGGPGPRCSTRAEVTPSGSDSIRVRAVWENRRVHDSGWVAYP